MDWLSPQEAARTSDLTQLPTLCNGAALGVSPCDTRRTCARLRVICKQRALPYAEGRFVNAFQMLMMAGPSVTTSMEGKMNSTNGTMSSTGARRAWASAR